MQFTIDVGAREQVCHQRTPSIFYTTATHRKKWNSSEREWSTHTSLWGGGGGGVKQWKWNMGKKEKLLIRTHTCQPSGLFGFRTRFTFLLVGQADVFRIFCLWLLSVFHSASHCSRAKTKDVTHFSLSGCFSSGTAKNRSVWSWHTGKLFGLRYKDLYWM